MPIGGRRLDAGRLLVLPALGLLLALFLWPLVALLAQSFAHPSGWATNYQRLHEAPIYYRVLLRTIWISAETALICLIVGYPVAYKLSVAGPLLRSLILVCIFVPFWTNLLVRTYGWIILLNPKGALNAALSGLGLAESPIELVYNRLGVLIGMSQIMLPYMILPLYAVMTRLDPRVMRAARSLGASPWQAFIKVYLPMTQPGVMAGLVLVFTISLGFFVIPAILGGRSGVMIAQLIEFNINQSLNWGLASALSACLLAVTVGLLWVGDRYFGLGSIWGIAK